MKKLIILITLILVLTGCNTDTPNNPDPTVKEQDTEGYVFKFGTTEIKMHDKAEAIIKALGEPMEYFEAPSCAFEGLDKFYYYSSFELNTYEIDDVDYISLITFKDDTVETSEGICIGSSLQDVLDTYGNKYEEQNGFYTYTLGKTKLQFITQDDVVTGITYSAIIDD